MTLPADSANRRAQPHQVASRCRPNDLHSLSLGHEACVEMLAAALGSCASFPYDSTRDLPVASRLIFFDAGGRSRCYLLCNLCAPDTGDRWRVFRLCL